jgi:hypothetical protein
LSRAENSLDEKGLRLQAARESGNNFAHLILIPSLLRYHSELDCFQPLGIKRYTLGGFVNTNVSASPNYYVKRRVDMNEIPSGGSMPGPSDPGVSPLSDLGPNSQHPVKLTWFRDHFQPHFNDWIFGPINRLVPSQDALIGFIFMACVIDYLAGFWWGKSTKGQVENAYTGFIDAYFLPGRYDSKGLYDSLRNGLVHMFTIKRMKYALSHNQSHLHLKRDTNGQIILNASDFRDDLVVAKQRYFYDVETKSELLDKAVERYVRDGFLDAGILEIKR